MVHRAKRTARSNVSMTITRVFAPVDIMAYSVTKHVREAPRALGTSSGLETKIIRYLILFLC
jgi:hypothetical protein